jgi:hypothetical protein
MKFKSSKFVGYSTEDERLRHVQPVKPLRAVVDGSGPSLIRALEGLRQFPDLFGGVLGDLMRNHIALMPLWGSSTRRKSTGFCALGEFASVAIAVHPISACAL